MKNVIDFQKKIFEIMESIPKDNHDIERMHLLAEDIHYHWLLTTDQRQMLYDHAAKVNDDAQVIDISLHLPQTCAKIVGKK
jgi:hypothetical protein